MTDPAHIQPQDYLLALAGTYLRNVLRLDGACSWCGGWANPGYSTCYVCGGLAPKARPDSAGYLTYAANGTTAGTLMYGYKEPVATLEQQSVIKLLSHRGFAHAPCAERLVGADITHSAAVPSTKGRADTHPLQQLVAPFLPWPLHTLSHQGGVSPARQRVQADLFVTNPLPPRSHVLVVEDTWTSGNRALSAVAALRAAGAEHVSLLCLARWLSFDFIRRPQHSPIGLHAKLLEQTVYDLGVCPFTGAGCPGDHQG